MALTKFTLSFTVVFSCVVCYLLSPNSHLSAIVKIIELFVAGMLVTGAANALNEAAEKDTDALMKRTASRPVASNKISRWHAMIFALVTSVIGIALMWRCFNWQAAALSAIGIFLYAYIYTPLKKVNSIAILIGAFPGALPCLIGWVAGFQPGGNNSWTGGIVMFLIQFIWQFPHFWAIAWVAHEDYIRAGFRLLPPHGEKPTRKTAMQAVLYSAMMVVIGLLPYFNLLGNSLIDLQTTGGKISFGIVLLCNLGMVVQSLRLYKNMDVKSARRVMFSSYIYLPIVLLALLFAGK
jgi:protoheme IX farnesyltransferase